MKAIKAAFHRKNSKGSVEDSKTDMKSMTNAVCETGAKNAPVLSTSGTVDNKNSNGSFTLTQSKEHKNLVPVTGTSAPLNSTASTTTNTTTNTTAVSLSI